MVYVAWLDYLHRAQPYVFIALICLVLMNQWSAWRDAYSYPVGHLWVGAHCLNTFWLIKGDLNFKHADLKKKKLLHLLIVNNIVEILH